MVFGKLGKYNQLYVNQLEISGCKTDVKRFTSVFVATVTKKGVLVTIGHQSRRRYERYCRFNR